MHWKGPVSGMLALALTGLVSATAVEANDAAFVVTGADLEVHRSATKLRVSPHPGFTQIGYPQRNHVGIIRKPVLVPEATVSEAVARTPAVPHLIRLKQGQTTVLIDPQANYRGEHPGGLDHNHSIIRAQRTHERLQTRGAHIVRRPNQPDIGDDRSAQEIQPRAILLRPNVLDKRNQDNQQRDIPMIPRPKKDEDRRQMAAAR